jgi:hypothetical protein
MEARSQYAQVKKEATQTQTTTPDGSNHTLMTLTREGASFY